MDNQISPPFIPYFLSNWTMTHSKTQAGLECLVFTGKLDEQPVYSNSDDLGFYSFEVVTRSQLNSSEIIFDTKGVAIFVPGLSKNLLAIQSLQKLPMTKKESIIFEQLDIEDYYRIDPSPCFARLSMPKINNSDYIGNKEIKDFRAMSFFDNALPALSCYFLSSYRGTYNVEEGYIDLPQIKNVKLLYRIANKLKPNEYVLFNNGNDLMMIDKSLTRIQIKNMTEQEKELMTVVFNLQQIHDGAIIVKKSHSGFQIVSRILKSKIFENCFFQIGVKAHLKSFPDSSLNYVWSQ